MNVPGFGAASSLGPSLRTYRRRAGGAGSSTGEVAMQQFRSPVLGGRFGTRLTCCSADGHFCRSRVVFPSEHCACAHGFDGEPIFNCSAVLSR